MNPKPEQLSQRYQALISAHQTLLFASAALDGLPELSVAPFVRDAEGCFYIYVSNLASHTSNLRNNPRCSVLFARPEAESANLFARERVVFTCTVSELSRDDARYAQHLQALTESFGETVKLLMTLPDFHLFSLKPIQGRYILGFGQAYQINLIDHTLVQIGRGN